MASGFLSGLVAGAALSGVALAAVSVASGPGQTGGPETAALEVPAGSSFNQSRDDTAARLPAADGAPQIGSDAPQVGAAAPDDLSAVNAEDNQPTSRPTLGGVEADLSAPQTTDEVSGMARSDAGSAATSQDTAPTHSDVDNAAQGNQTISADPTQPSLPDVESGAGFSDGDTPEQGDATAQAAPVPELPKDNEAETADAAPVPQDGLADDNAPPSTIGDMADNVQTGRLPSVGAQETVEMVDSPTKNHPAIKVNAVPFANPDGKPLMALVLIDDGTSPIGLEALDAFPYPLSFAIDAMRPDAQETMQRYRDAGFEVLAIADLPEGADARDTETVMQTVFAAVPQAVGVLEGTDTGLQISRDASEQLAPILLESGHGLVLFPKGLQTALKLIAREGVPVGTVFRDFDSNDQSATVIRRFLDQAAFKAGREDEGSVIMLGRLRADTISALLLWGLQDRASQVALAPISAVLTQGN